MKVLVNFHHFPRLLYLPCLPVKLGSRNLSKVSICFAKLRGGGRGEREQKIEIRKQDEKRDPWTKVTVKGTWKRLIRSQLGLAISLIVLDGQEGSSLHLHTPNKEHKERVGTASGTSPKQREQSRGQTHSRHWGRGVGFQSTGQIWRVKRKAVSTQKGQRSFW